MARANRKPVVISPQAKQDIELILYYLKENWNQRVVDNFLYKLETFLTIVSINPHVFGYYSKSRNIRNYAISKHQVIYYRNKRKIIQVIAVFDSRQSPSKLKRALNK